MSLERKEFVVAGTLKADKGEALVRFALPDGKTPDRDGDITPPDALPEGAKVVMSQFGHRSLTDGELPAGRAVIHRNGTADVKFFLDTTAGRETFATIKGLGELAQYSYGFQILEVGQLTPAMRDAGAKRVLQKLRPVELSAVVMAAGMQTGTLALKRGGSALHPFNDEAKRARVAAICRNLTPRPVTPSMLRNIERQHAAFICDSEPPSEIQQKEARYWADRATDLMGQTRVSIEWSVSSIKDAGAFRATEPNRIFLNPRLGVDAIAPVVLHECAHRCRFLKRLPNTERFVEADTRELCELLEVA